MAAVIVVGSGIGGLIAALAASATHTVTLVTKSRLDESNTLYAQGGIAAAVFADDTVQSHVADTLDAGAGLNVLAAVEVLCTEGPDRIADLIRFGVEFDRSASGPGAGLEGTQGLARGLEAAHSVARVLHSGGDATGAAIERALVTTVRNSAVTILEHTFLADLVVTGGRISGVDVVGPSSPAVQRLDADAVILASGGAGQLFAHTTNPAIATGDGAAAAWRAGALLADVEFYQFHPTAMATPGNFLVSEAVRGEGAVLRASDGTRFMGSIHPDGDLAARDIVARGIANQMAAQNGEPVLLDAAALGADFLRRRFPTIDAACARAGIDWAARPVPVTPAAHYWMGGVATDTHGRTSIPGLYAVGEVACTGAHGANRLASNSLLESAVMAHRAATVVGESDWPQSSPWTAHSAGAPAAIAVPSDSTDPAVDAAVAPPFSRAALQNLLWDAAGVHRTRTALSSAAATLAQWDAAAPGRTVPAVADREDANLLDLARLLVGAALAREESRGAHYRSDFPTDSPEFAHHIVWAREVYALC